MIAAWASRYMPPRVDDEQRKRILAIADRCPVDLTLVRGSDVQTRLVGTFDEARDATKLA